MNVSKYVCMYVCIYACMYVPMYVRTHVSMYVRVYMYVFVALNTATTPFLRGIICVYLSVMLTWLNLLNEV